MCDPLEPLKTDGNVAVQTCSISSPAETLY